jgi:hypothetical protein
MNELIQNEIVELTTLEKTEIKAVFISIIDAIKNDITNS